MSSLQVQGHDEVAALFRRALGQGRLASTFLFAGPEGIGKRTFALWFAQALLCETRDEKLLDPCGHCPACLQVAAGTHPDLMSIAKPRGKSEIPVGLLKGDPPDYPIEQSLLFNLSLRPFHGGRKVAIVDDANHLNPAGANCLLKTLEEPPPNSVLILISSSVDQQLPTIRSRAQIVRFKPLDAAIIARLLVEQGVVSEPDEAQRLAAFCEGSLSRAVELADPQLWLFRGELLSRLAQSSLPSIAMVQSILKFVEAAGKEAPARRARLRMVIGFVADFFRQLVRRLAGLPADADSQLANAVASAAATNAWEMETAADAARRSLEAIMQIERNANQSTLVEAWLDDLLLLSRRQAVSGRA